MDGDLAPLSDLASLAEQYGARLYVDDAHGTGVMGPTGRGTIEHYGLEERIPFHMGTLSKAIGSYGAYIVGSNDVVQYLINVTRPFIFTTALPPATAAAASSVVSAGRNSFASAASVSVSRRLRWLSRTWMAALFDGLRS